VEHGLAVLPTVLAVVSAILKILFLTIEYPLESGICSFPYDSTLIALSSGELHLIRNVSGKPYMDDATSTELMLAHRNALADANKSKLTDDLTVRLQGFDGLYCDLVGGSFVFASIHE
jgi:hypothetical protein